MAIRDPREQGAILSATQLGDGQSIATSGDYEACVETDSGRMHHLLDPRSGYPARGMRSVTVKGRDAAFVDALCTGLFVLGRECGLDMVDSLSGCEALLLTADGKTLDTSPGFDVTQST